MAFWYEVVNSATTQNLQGILRGSCGRRYDLHITGFVNNITVSVRCNLL